MFRVLLFCDGNATMGFGHVSRCLALAEAFEELGIQCHFVGQIQDGAEDLIRSTSFNLTQTPEPLCETDLQGLLSQITGETPEWIVLDCHPIPSAFAQRLLRCNLPIVQIDDLGIDVDYPWNALLNYSFAAEEIRYPSLPDRKFLGPEYFLARRDLRNIRESASVCADDVADVFVSLGGVDFHNCGTDVLESLLEIAPHVSVNVVVGRSNRQQKKLSRIVDKFEGESRLLVQVPGIAALLARADLAICGAGVTKDEALYLGVPVALVSQHRIQLDNTAGYVKRNLVADLGYAEDINKHAVSRQLEKLFCDGARRKSFSARSLAAFPDDPTLNAAGAISQVMAQYASS